jgi:hypothetical protein
MGEAEVVGARPQATVTIMVISYRVSVAAMSRLESACSRNHPNNCIGFTQKLISPRARQGRTHTRRAACSSRRAARYIIGYRRWPSPIPVNRRRVPTPIGELSY